MTEITLYNTRSRRKEKLTPVVPGRVGMYVCGPTVYDRAHIGNARPVVVFDTLFRLLRHGYGAENVTYVRNFTDVDDKINARAAATLMPGETELQAIRRITDETIGWYHADMDALGALPPQSGPHPEMNCEPRATEFIAPMVAMIETLIAKGHAYAAEGHVLFNVASYSEYGALSNQNLQKLRSGARVEPGEYKPDDPMDFVLWKPSTPDQPGWDGPKIDGESIGRGRPGWHIECSAMAYDLLGPSFDIHGGGIDLVFPHHENEIAQSKCAHPEGHFANIWMHNGFVNVEGEKMSKSEGNFFTVRDLLDRGIPGEVIRLVLLSSHYRQPLDWTERRLAQEKDRLLNWRLELSMLGQDILEEDPSFDTGEDFLRDLSDDLNVPSAMAKMSIYAKHARKGSLDAGRYLVRAMRLLGIDPNEDGILSLLIDQRDSGIKRVAVTREYEPIIGAVLRRRAEARSAGDFKLADELRDALHQSGVGIVDTSNGPVWAIEGHFDPEKLKAFL